MEKDTICVLKKMPESNELGVGRSNLNTREVLVVHNDDTSRSNTEQFPG